MYLKEEFAADLIAILPMTTLSQLVFADMANPQLMYFVKIIRILKGIKIFDRKTFMRQVQNYYTRKMQKIIDEDPNLAENQILDNNYI